MKYLFEQKNVRQLITRVRLRFARALVSLGALLFMLLTPGCQPAAPLLDRIQQHGTLVVATRKDPSTFYEVDDNQYNGFEYQLVTHYADSLGVDVEWKTYGDIGDMLHALEVGDVQLVAAGIAVTPERSKRFHFAPAYTQTRPVVIQRNDVPVASSLGGIKGRIVVSSQSAHAEKLRQLQQESPQLNWDERDDLPPIALLSLLNQGEADHVIVNEHVFEQARSLFPNLQQSFALDDPQELAWAVNRHEDESLLLSLRAFYQKIEKTGFLAQLRNQHFDSPVFDFVGASTFLSHIEARLPRFEESFRAAAVETGFDWRLLAAVGYQESLWNPNAVSPTGVTGLMMLTQGAAKEVGVTDRRNAQQSIRGGGRYFRQIHDKMPVSIPENQRVWFALAAYNMGLGHLWDARRLTREQGANPDNWFDVEKRIPLLQKPAFYRHARHGYAQAANQAVGYVRSIRRYYETLVWSESHPMQPYSPIPDSVAALPRGDYVL